MPAVLVLSRPRTELFHLFTIETSLGPIIVVYFDESRLRAMAAAVQAVLDPKNAELRRMNLDQHDLDGCIRLLAENFPDASAQCIDDEHELWPRVLAAMQQSDSLTI